MSASMLLKSDSASRNVNILLLEGHEHKILFKTTQHVNLCEMLSVNLLASLSYSAIDCFIWATCFRLH